MKIYERQSEMVSDMAKELRSRLVEGECCPVCGQTVVHVFSDEQFESLLQPFRKEKEAAEKKYRDAKDVFDTLTASVGSKGKGLKGYVCGSIVRCGVCRGDACECASGDS